MSKEEEKPPFTKKQLSIIFKIAFLEAMALSIIIPTVQTSGELPPKGCGNGFACNTASDSCTISAGSNTCGKTTTWAKPLPFAPCGSCGSVVIRVAGGTSGFIVTTDTKVFFTMGTDWAIVGAWPGMPAVLTEIYGDQAHRIIADWSAATAFSFTILCATASNSVTALLKVQFSRDSGTTWTDLTNSGISIANGSANCNAGNPNPTETIEYQSIDVLARIHSVLLRVVGLNGAGAGDNPIITGAYISYQTSQVILFVAEATIQALFADHIVVNIFINLPQTASLTVSYGVTSWDCTTVSALQPC